MIKRKEKEEVTTFAGLRGWVAFVFQILIKKSRTSLFAFNFICILHLYSVGNMYAWSQKHPRKGHLHFCFKQMQ